MIDVMIIDDNEALRLGLRIFVEEESDMRVVGKFVSAAVSLSESSGPHHQDSGEAKIRESTAGVSRNCWQSAQVGQIRTREDYYYEELRGSSLRVLL